MISGNIMLRLHHLPSVFYLKGNWKECLGWWNYPVSWLWWWLHESCMCKNWTKEWILLYWKFLKETMAFQKIWKLILLKKIFRNDLLIMIKSAGRFSSIYVANGWNKLDFPGGSDSKASVYNAGDPGSIPGSGRAPGEGNGNPLQYYCLENPMDRGTW